MKSINEIGGLFALALSAIGVIGCDVESEPVEERAFEFEFDGSATTGEIAQIDHADELREPPSQPRVERADDDECGFGDVHMPAFVIWKAGEVLQAEVGVDSTIGSEDRVTLQFHAGRMGARNIQPMGKPITVRGGGSFTLPEELLAEVRSGKQYVAMARLEVCEADNPQQNCFKTNTDVMNIEDGKFFTPAEFAVYQRAKYSSKYPWLFEDGVGAIIIEGEGE